MPHEPVRHGGAGSGQTFFELLANVMFAISLKFRYVLLATKTTQAMHPQS